MSQVDKQSPLVSESFGTVQPLKRAAFCGNVPMRIGIDGISVPQAMAVCIRSRTRCSIFLSWVGSSSLRPTILSGNKLPGLAAAYVQLTGHGTNRSRNSSLKLIDFSLGTYCFPEQLMYRLKARTGC